MEPAGRNPERHSCEESPTGLLVPTDVEKNPDVETTKSKKSLTGTGKACWGFLQVYLFENMKGASGGAQELHWASA